MGVIVFVVFSIVALHGVDGREISVNPAEITSLREARPTDYNGDKAFTKGAHCMISLTDGHFVTVSETCAETRKLITDEIRRLQEVEEREYRNRGFDP